LTGHSKLANDSECIASDFFTGLKSVWGTPVFKNRLAVKADHHHKPKLDDMEVQWIHPKRNRRSDLWTSNRIDNCNKE